MQAIAKLQVVLSKKAEEPSSASPKPDSEATLKLGGVREEGVGASGSRESVDEDDAELEDEQEWNEGEQEWDGESWAGSQDLEAWEYQEDWEEWVKGRYDGEELSHDEEEDANESLDKACDKALKADACSKRPVATPARTGPPLHRLPGTLDLKPPSETTTVVESTLRELGGDGDAVVVNSTTHKKEYMRLDA